MMTHSSTLAWKIPWMEDPGGLQSMGSLRVRHNWATSLSLFTFMHWRGKQHPTPVFSPGESQGQGSLVAAVYGVTQSRKRLKRLSSRNMDFTMFTILQFTVLSGVSQIEKDKHMISLIHLFIVQCLWQHVRDCVKKKDKVNRIEQASDLKQPIIHCNICKVMLCE